MIPIVINAGGIGAFKFALRCLQEFDCLSVFILKSNVMLQMQAIDNNL